MYTFYEMRMSTCLLCCSKSVLFPRLFFVVSQNNPVAGCVLLRGSSPIVLLPRTQFLLRLTCLSQPPRFPILTIQTFSGLLLQIPFVLLFQSFGQPCHFQFQSIRHVFFFVLFQIVSFPQSLFQQIFGLFRFERYFLSPPCFRFTQGTVC